MSDIANRLKEARRNKRKTSFYNWFFFRSRGDSPFAKLVIHAVLIFASLVSIYPALRVLSVSLRSGNRVVSTSLDLIPTERVQIPADMTDEEFEEYRYRTPEGVRDRIRDLASGKQTSGDVTKSFTYPNGETVEYVVYDVMTDLDFERAIYTPPQDLERAMIEELSIGVNFIPATLTYVDAVGDTQTQNFQIPDGVTEEMLLGYINEQVENNNFVNQPWRNRQGTLTYAGKTITPEFVPSNLDTFTFRDEMLFEVQQTKEKAYITATGLNYAAVLFDAEEENRGFLTWIWNSILITMSTAFLGMTLASTAAYAFSRFTFPGKRTGLIFLLGTQMIPAAMMMLPIYLLADAMGLIGSLNGLIFAYSVGSIPFSIWILKGYYDTILTTWRRQPGSTERRRCRPSSGLSCL
jgi:ABC-type maltose transport system permease subunit